MPVEKITTIYNPYNFDDMLEKGQQPLPEEAKTFFESGFVFANMGRMVYQKALWHMVKAFSLVRQAHPEAKLVLIGEDKTDGKLQKLIQELQLQDGILLTGRVRNPYQFLQNAHGYVLSSLFEGFPNALVEAMACGLPVIATDCPSGPREILYSQPDLSKTATEVTMADHGILIPLPEAEENWAADHITEGERFMAQAMCRLLEDSALRQEMTEKALARSHTFDFAAALEAFGKVIEE